VVLVLLVAVGALGVALVTRGTALGRVHLRAVRLLVAAAVVQLVTSTLAPGSALARGVALVLTTLLVGLFVVGNRRVAGTPLIGLGLLLNVLVVGANAAMPVSVDAAARAGLAPSQLDLERDAMREEVGPGTRLPWLGDVVPVALPWRPQVVSPGDVLVAAGVGLLLVTARGRSRPGVPTGRSAGARTPQTPSREDRSTVEDRHSTTVGSYS
jgi:hypothetical protein